MSEYSQASFSGGMNLLVDDTRLKENEYREAFNVRNRFDVLDPILEAIESPAPDGIKQGIYTFGDYLLAFVAGRAYYKFRLGVAWQVIDGFAMDSYAARFWIINVPVATTRFGRLGIAKDAVLAPNSGIDLVNIAGTGNASGILVQDNINQPFFIFLNATGYPEARSTQKYSDWSYDSTGVNDMREYVPIGNLMEWQDGILFIVAPDGETIYRSVSGRPLDFVINVTLDGSKGGDASTTAYSVGVGDITCIKAQTTGGLFVACGNRVCFNVRANAARTLWGEPEFIRTFLFTAGCVSERCVVDLLGDLAFVDPEGLRSYNAVLQQQYEGRNSVFSLKVAALFKGQLQGPTACAISFDNYALFSVATIYGPVILVYDTLNQCFVGMDTQAGVYGIKQFAKIDTDVTELYAITEDDRLLKLYSGIGFATSTVRLRSNCSQNPSLELQPSSLRCTLNNIRQDSVLTATCFVNNRLSGEVKTKTIKYIAPATPYTGSPMFSDTDSQFANLFINWNSANQGFKCYFLLSWTGGGSVTNLLVTAEDNTPRNPALTQANELAQL